MYMCTTNVLGIVIQYCLWYCSDIRFISEKGILVGDHQLDTFWTFFRTDS
jgi:hypothetical protein